MKRPKEVPAAMDQPPPLPGGVKVLPEVIRDLIARSEVGYKRYGTFLMSNNGRDALLDVYQESLDQTMYLKQELIERAQGVVVPIAQNDGHWRMLLEKQGFGLIHVAVREEDDIWHNCVMFDASVIVENDDPALFEMISRNIFTLLMQYKEKHKDA